MAITKLFSFLTKTNNTFEEKRDYENVIFVLRRHWFVISTQIFLFAFVLIIGFVLALILMARFNDPDIISAILFFFSIFLLFWWAELFYAITMYLLDVWIITDHRVIDSEQRGFFRRQIAELNLSKVQDISVRMIGFVPTFLNYGNLEIQTAGIEQKFELKQISDPEGVKDKLSHLSVEYMNVHIGGAEIHERTSGV